MPEFQNDTAGAPVWADLSAPDRLAAIAFYRELFGWHVDESSFPTTGYTYFELSGQRVAGLAESAGYPGWNIYLQTEDARASAELVTAAGGEALAVVPFGPTGTVGHFLDPHGVWIGGWQAGSHSGFGVTDEPGAPTWFELHTRHYPESIEFFTRAFGWEVHPMPEAEGFRMATLGDIRVAQAGIYDAEASLPEDSNGRWLLYFQVEDTDTTIVRALRLGGTVVQEASDTPYGRMAEIADTAGIRFAVIQP